MTNPIVHLESTLAEAHRLMGQAADPSMPTPCNEFDVGGLLDHMATWIAVFGCAVNDETLDFDPEAFHLDSGWADHFRGSADHVLAGLRTHGWDRPMTMTSDPIPGSIVVDMLSMEYIGHGLDLAHALRVGHRFTTEQAETALAASERLIQEQYRGTGPGQFHPIVETAPDADAVDRFVAFLGRDPEWAPA
jgi:uncharacterized protein (TIGR03086 family)